MPPANDTGTPIKVTSSEAERREPDRQTHTQGTVTHTQRAQKTPLLYITVH